MSRINVSASTVEEKFMFGSPPLLNGFTTMSSAYNSCRLEDTYTASARREPLAAYDYQSKNDAIHACRTNYPGGLVGGLVGGLNQLSFSHVENGLKILEKAGIQVHSRNSNNNNAELTFRKRKDLRTLQNTLSKERYREVAMKFGDGGDEGSKEILESVHNTMRKSKQAQVKCVFCSSASQVYENFPIVDGTLFLTPVASQNSIRFCEYNAKKQTRYMCYICVKCLEGQRGALRCLDCNSAWNGSFFQVGTLYSYNILSAIPCCQRQLCCKNCSMAILDMSKGETTSLFFSHFSKKATCPYCNVDDFHFIKALSKIQSDREL